MARHLFRVVGTRRNVTAFSDIYREIAREKILPWRPSESKIQKPGVSVRARLTHDAKTSWTTRSRVHRNRKAEKEHCARTMTQKIETGRAVKPICETSRFYDFFVT